MRLIAQRPCNFGGKMFFIGDEIPAELVENPKAQEKMGVIAISAGCMEDGKFIEMPANDIRSFPGNIGELQVAIPIEAESGTQTLSAAPESIIEAIKLMQMDVKEAEKEIESLEDENALIILHACDSRKGIKNASEKRALMLQQTEEQMDLSDMEESAGDA